MASNKEFVEFTREQLGNLNIMIRPMMGEYLIYCDGKLFGGIYDNRLLIKKTKIGKELLPEAKEVFPYDGSKTLMLFVENLDDRDFLEKLIVSTCAELPLAKNK